MKAALALLAASLVLLATGAGGARMLDSTGSHMREFPPVLVAGTDSGPGLLPTAKDPCANVRCRGDRRCRIVGAKGVCRCPPGLKPKFHGSSHCVVNPCYHVTCRGTKVCRNPGGIAKCTCKSWQVQDPDHPDLCIAKSEACRRGIPITMGSTSGANNTTATNQTKNPCIGLVPPGTIPSAASSPPGGAPPPPPPGTDSPGNGTPGVPPPSPIIVHVPPSATPPATSSPPRGAPSPPPPGPDSPGNGTPGVPPPSPIIGHVPPSSTPPATSSPPRGASPPPPPGTDSPGVPPPSPMQGRCPVGSHAESVGGVPVCVCNDVDSSWVAGMCQPGKVAFAQYLDPHNQLRAALGLGSLTWSSKVAAHAQKWADRIRDDLGCKPQHPSGTEGANYPYGQNLVWGWGLVDSTAVNEWVKEGKYWDNSLSPDGCVKGPTKSWVDCGHYTQVAWRHTTSLGCGKVECLAGTVWVCEYDPPGNWIGEKPY